MHFAFPKLNLKMITKFVFITIIDIKHPVSDKFLPNYQIRI